MLEDKSISKIISLIQSKEVSVKEVVEYYLKRIKKYNSTLNAIVLQEDERKILDEANKNHKKDSNNAIEKYTNKFLKDITHNLENFSYNKLIANLHEMYSFMHKQIQEPYTKMTLIENYQKILIAMTPIVPHFSNECLEQINIKNFEWPKIDSSLFISEKVNIVVQVNGKKREVINTTSNLSEGDLFKLVRENETIKKYLNDQKIKRKIFIKNKLINIII